MFARTFLFAVLLLRDCYIAHSKQVIYITSTTADDDNCTVNGMTLWPCHTLYQLREIINEASLSLIFLPEVHNILQSIFLFDYSELEMSPLDKQLETKINCSNEMLRLQNIKILKIHSLNFISCTLYCKKTKADFNGSIEISRSIFEGAEENYPLVIFDQSTVVVSNCTFMSNLGAIHIDHNILETFTRLMITDTVIKDNWSYNIHGIVSAQNTELIVQRSSFINNTGDGSVIRATGFSLELDSTEFAKNRVGNLVIIKHLRIYAHRCSFVNNSAVGDGTVNAEFASRSSFENCSFQGNQVNGRGGALYITATENLKIMHCLFQNNTAVLGGAIFVKKLYGVLSQEYAIIIYDNIFAYNRVQADGGAIYCENCGFSIADAYSIQNTAIDGRGGFLYLTKCQIALQSKNINTLNKAQKGGAIYASNSDFMILGDVTFSSNIASESGGAVVLYDSVLVFPFSFKLTFTWNIVTSASGKGGAIFVVDSNCEQIPDSDYPATCFVDGGDESSDRKYMIFVNNTAYQGPVLYGGLLDRCQYPSGHRDIKSLSQYQSTPLAITSDPIRVCLCSDTNQVNCTTRELSVSILSGAVIKFMGAVVDQFQYPKESFIKASYIQSEAKLGKGESKLDIMNSCTELSYHIFTAKKMATLILAPEGYCEHSKFSTVTVNITVMPCSLGFELDRDEGRCVCERRMMNFVITCDIDTGTIQRKNSTWLAYDEMYLKVHPNCPLDYCNATSRDVNLAFQDQQCANHRSGVLCGGCPHNYSIALGGSKCLPCTEKYSFIWLIVVFALAGVVLVAFLLVCNMTISHGTLNGLIFYANVVSISGLTNLQNCSLHPILSVFIAWVNLDLGIETCFYPGMDTYQKTWLQFAFPLYIILLVIAILVASYYSSTAMKVFGRNNIALLATLFLLSYSKALKTIISVLSATQVLASAADNISAPMLPYSVWLYDGNVEYLKGKHVVLFTVALLFLLILFIPYTLLLTFGQCLRSLPVRRRLILRLIRSTAFVSIMDAYHAPYNRRHRYWTGLMLLTRCVLFLAFAFSGQSTNLYTITLVLIAIFSLKVSVYKCFFNNILELAYILNLFILSVTLLYLQSSINVAVICKCTSSSVSASMTGFIGILAYHAYLQGKKFKLFVSVEDYLRLMRKSRLVPIIAQKEDSAPQTVPPSTTSVELREALLASV